MIAKDKQLHIAGGAAVAVATLIVWFVIRHHLDAAAFPLAGLASAWAGDLKEVYDHDRPEAHSEEAWDATATSLGGTIVAGFGYLAWIAGFIR